MEVWIDAGPGWVYRVVKVQALGGPKGLHAKCSHMLKHGCM
jgi:hypothetical protein